MKLYSATTGGFYITGVHADIPADAVEITDDRHAELLQEQASGKTIQADSSGVPQAVVVAMSYQDWLDKVVRPERDRIMDDFEWRIARCLRADRRGETPVENITVLDDYMQLLADFPATLTAIVDTIVWPTAPADPTGN